MSETGAQKSMHKTTQLFRPSMTYPTDEKPHPYFSATNASSRSSVANCRS